MSRIDWKKNRRERLNRFSDDYFSAPESATVQSIGQYYEQEPKVFSILFPWGTRPIAAGPYRDKPHEQPGIKLAAEINARCIVDCPIKDFGVPDPKLIESALLSTMTLMRGGIVPYVGCWGGKGRTGLFLALMLKVSYQLCRRFWHSREIDYVAGIRNLYSIHAVETQDQEDFVRDFDVSWLVKEAKRLK